MDVSSSKDCIRSVKVSRFGPEGRFTVQFRTQVVNIANHCNFGPPSSIFIEDSDGPVIDETGALRGAQMFCLCLPDLPYGQW